MTVAEATPCHSLVWHVTEAFHDLTNLEQKDEWLGTNIIWQLEEQKNATKVTVTHNGLSPFFVLLSNMPVRLAALFSQFANLLGVWAR